MQNFARIKWTVISIAIAGGFVPASLRAADAEHARRSLDSLEQFLKDATPDGLRHAQEAVESIKQDLDGLDAAVKAPLARRFADDLKKVDAATFADDKARYMRTFTRKFDAAKELVAPGQENVNPAFRLTSDDLKRAQDELDSDSAKKFITPTARQSYANELAAIKKTLGERALGSLAETIQSRLADVEAKLPNLVKAAKTPQEGSEFSNLERSIAYDLKNVGGPLKDLPADNPRVKELAARWKKASDTYDAAVVAGEGPEVLEKVNVAWTARIAAVDEWEREKAGPTFEQYAQSDSKEMKFLGAPKTVELVAIADRFLAEFFQLDYQPGKGKNAYKTDGEYRPFLADPKTRAIADEAIKQRDAAAERVAKFASDLLTQAQTAKLDDESRKRLETLVETDIPAALAGAPQLAELQQRGRAILGKQ